jgi:hypothetical protein
VPIVKKPKGKKMLLKTSQNSLKTAFEYVAKLPFSKKILQSLSEIARGKSVAYFFLHRVLKDNEKTHPHYLNKTAITVKEARIMLSHIKSLLPFISLPRSLELLTAKTPIKKSQAVLLIETPYLETIELLKPVLEEMMIPATLVLDTESLNSGQMPWTDEIVFRLGQTHKKELCVNFIDRTFPLVSASERLIAAQHFIENLNHASPQVLKSRMEQIRETLDEVALPPVGERICTLPKLEQLALNPLFSFACAGRMRLPFFDVSLADAKDEVAKAKHELTSLFPTSFYPVFIYPKGTYKRKANIVRLLMEEGFIAAISKNQGLCRPGDNMFELKSLPLASSNSLEQFELQGLSDAIDEFLLVTLAKEKGK